MTTDVFRLSASDYPFGIFKLFSDKDNEIMSTSILLTIHIDFSYSWLWHLHHLDIDMYCHIHYFREKKSIWTSFWSHRHCLIKDIIWASLLCWHRRSFDIDTSIFSCNTHCFSTDIIWTSLEMPVPSQGHYGFHSFPVVDWFCLFIYLWVLTFPL
jgi:hypothetical protein